MDVVIFTALPWERRAVRGALGLVAAGPGRWRGRLDDGTESLLVQTGVGPERARAAALAAPPAALFLACGCAGALVSHLETGDAVAARDVLVRDAGGTVVQRLGADGRALAAFAGEQGQHVVVGDVLSSPGLLAGTAAKADAAATGALVVDMESGAVAVVAAMRGIRCAALRVVLDRLGDALPFGADVIDGASGAVRPGRVAAGLVRPRHWRAAVRLGRQQRVAGGRLAALATALRRGGLAGLGGRPAGRQAAAN